MKYKFTRRWKEHILHGRYTWWLLERERIVADISTFPKGSDIWFLATIRLKKNRATGEEGKHGAFPSLEDAKRWVEREIPKAGQLHLFLENRIGKVTETLLEAA